ncbi:hypothetical protein BDY24DRAFT_413167 [Mrakia frigida]|uniref:uncharacterized protein n=1 Tax=Mrakia frigida TaxID=29902 RepID=UPI003FCBF05C
MVQILTLLTTLALVAPTFVLADTFDVQIGKDGLTFTPNSIKAVSGDIVNFVFATNGVSHTVVPSTSFLQPCASSTTSTFPTLNGPIGSGTVGYTVPSSDTQSAVGLLITTGKELVFVVNPPTTDSNHGGQSISNFQKHATFTVEVGRNGNTYEPDFVNAVAGDTIIFNFSATTYHDVLTSVSFDQPCREFTSARQSSTDAGVEKRQSDSILVFSPINGGPVEYSVTTSGTIWAHCSVGSHCEQGMVFAINPDPAGGTQTIDAFKALAMGASPNSTSSSVVDQASSAVAAASSTAAAAASQTPGAGDRTASAGGVGGLLGVALLVIGGWLA